MILKVTLQQENFVGHLCSFQQVLPVFGTNRNTSVFGTDLQSNYYYHVCWYNYSALKFTQIFETSANLAWAKSCCGLTGCIASGVSPSLAPCRGSRAASAVRFPRSQSRASPPERSLSACSPSTWTGDGCPPFALDRYRQNIKSKIHVWLLFLNISWLQPFSM